ncbi:4'-phosphopantetheinyl transferase superfamily protein [Kitasatospora sp. NBC_01250]|uniref:4'-phosphopantetheinyl transferase family protein n=1 Tax=unclassified Kitasatospora TaxID=2633591 RepID=UPI002E0DF8BE|nr:MULTISPECIES: 4'-phosphopantetheinyl transferase superfamily protein [unclassified Kitasatospora]WSJ69279.1 4'-phosphopantetheinyl transferase superfamily protein [Kitasatospora sp. NBC_01302]
MIERILPDAVVTVADTSGAAVTELLFPAEEALISTSVATRQHEFRAVRLCARRALTELGVPVAPILPGLRGAPTWPAGVVGSMTHCLGYRAAALAHAKELLSIGIDAEPAEPLPEGVLEAIARPEELTRLRTLGAQRPEVPWDRLLFSAKESVYKAWFPLTQVFLDFSEASLSFDVEGGFTAQLLVPPPLVEDRPLTGFTGRWLVAEGIALTAIAVPHRS